MIRHPKHNLFVPWLFLAFSVLACNFPLGRQPAGFPEARPASTTGSASIDSTDAQLPGSTGADPNAGVPDPGVQTVAPGAPAPVTPLPAELVSDPGMMTYLAQSGDTLPAIARRFGVEPEQISSPEILPAEAYLRVGQLLLIPRPAEDSPYPDALLPDSEVIYSPAAVDFEIEAYLRQTGGFLGTYTETVGEEPASGAEIVRRVARDFSVNPQVLLAFLEYRSHWVLGQPADQTDLEHPLGFYVPGYRGLYYELTFAATKLNNGYYGWRQGTLTELVFEDGSRARLHPPLNAGSVALQYLFSKFYDPPFFLDALSGAEGFLVLYGQMFGDAWERAAVYEPLFPVGLAQPVLQLPFATGDRWSFSGGPHLSWSTGTPAGALDFSPTTGEPPCSYSSAWVTASAAGVVTRSEHNVVVIDLDGDGHEQTGWVLVFLHLADRDRVAPGNWVDVDTPLGHPSCERGKSTGTHVHLARRFNGEWLPADGPLPFVLSGWEVSSGARSYQGYLTKGDQVVVANPSGAGTSIIVR